MKKLISILLAVSSILASMTALAADGDIVSDYGSADGG